MRGESPTAVINGKLYCFGGFENSLLMVTPQVDVYDPLLDSWSQVANMPRLVTHAGVVQDGTDVWFLGGFEGHNPGIVVRSVAKYDSLTDTWASGPELPAPRGAGGAALLGRDLHFFGGVSLDRDTDRANHWVLDLDNLAGGWSSLPSMPDARNHFSVAAVGSTIYLLGGQHKHDTNPVDLDEVYAFDSMTGFWSQKADLPFTRSHAEPGTFVEAGLVYLVGGRSGELGLNSISDIHTYDPLTDTFAVAGSLPFARIAPCARAIDGELIVVGGGEGPVKLKDEVWRRPLAGFDPQLVRLNCGGAAYVDSGTLQTWCADQMYLGGSVLVDASGLDVQGTVEDELYRVQRQGDQPNPFYFAYRFPLASGSYRVDLHFSEPYWGVPGGGLGQPGEREIHAVLEGQLLIERLDLFAEVGALQALVKTLHVVVSDGALDLELISAFDNPILAALEVFPDPLPVGSFCPGATNSTGLRGTLGTTGSSSVSANDLGLVATQLVPSKPVLFIYSQGQNPIPLGAGTLCLTGGTIARLNPNLVADITGAVSRPVDLTQPPLMAGLITPGTSWNFQCWYRDPVGGGFNLTNAVHLDFGP